LVAEYAGQATLWLVPAMVLIVGIYVYTYRRKRKSTASPKKVESSGEEISGGNREGQ
jgi:cytochrome c-type biogenesis protein CcmH/NrfF